METAALDEVREQIEALYADRGDGFELPRCYATLLNVERVLLQAINGRNDRRAPEVGVRA
jgi:hypothetical protein